MLEVRQTKPTTAITLRNLPPKLVRKLQQRARVDGTSFNEAVIRVLEERFELREWSPRELAGKWSKREAAEFDRALRQSRSIDDEMWV